MTSASQQLSALIVGASRGLGLGLARAYLERGWRVIATVRDASHPSGLHDCLAVSGEALTIETVDILSPPEIASLRQRLSGRSLDLLFVSAGVTNRREETIGEISTEEFCRVMQTNALGPMRVVESFADVVRPDGTIAVMSSGLASVGANTEGGMEVYRASKAALNTLMRSYAARQAGNARSVLLIAPGWVRTDMGGDAAPLDIETSVRGIADTIASHRGKPGVAFCDYRGETVQW